MTLRRLAWISLALAAAGALAGCGKQAELVRPTPLAQTQAPVLDRDQAARRALQDASAKADPRAPESYGELRASTSLHRNRVRVGSLDPSAPHPPGSSPTQDAVPASSSSQ
jgi:hypothetical protein